MAISISSTKSANGARPLNLRRDAFQVLKLLEAAFGDSLDQENRLTLQRDLSLTGRPWLKPFLSLTNRFTPGFVWEDDRHIVGNVSLMPSSYPGRYLIANVAVHPNWQRQGIAHELMGIALDYIANHRGSHVMLQVHHENHAAQELYYSLDFKNVGALTHWYGEPSRLTEPSPLEKGGNIRQLPRKLWREAYELDVAALPLDLVWPDPLPADAYQQTIWRAINNFINGRQAEYWVAFSANGKLAGIASILSQFNRAHSLSIRVAPSHKGHIERQLLTKILRRLPFLAYRRSRIDHPADDTIMNLLLENANFVAKRTLVTMRLDL